MGSIYRDDIKDPAELGLMKGSRCCGPKEGLPTGRAPSIWVVLSLPTRSTKGLHRWSKPDGTQKESGSLLKV